MLALAAMLPGTAGGSASAPTGKLTSQLARRLLPRAGIQNHAAGSNDIQPLL